MKFILQTNNLSKSYHRREVLKNVSLKVPQNCVYGLLGPNGAGKSTLLKIISGIVHPTNGDMFFEGHSWERNDLLEIGALIESPPIYHNLNAYENMKVRAMMLGVEEQQIDKVLEIVGLQDVGKKRAGHYSLGMKQRLGIAVSILNQPKFLILDEPTNGLDPFGIEELRKLIKKFVKEGITVLVSSHILSEIQQIADYVGILCNGELKYEGMVNKGENLEELFMNIAKDKLSCL